MAKLLLTCVCTYVCMYDLNEVPPDPPGLWPFHIRDYIPDFILFINNLVQPQTTLLQGCFGHATVSHTYLPQCTTMW